MYDVAVVVGFLAGATFPFVNGLAISKMYAHPHRIPRALARKLTVALVLTSSLALVGLGLSYNDLLHSYMFLVPVVAWLGVLDYMYRAIRP